MRKLSQQLPTVARVLLGLAFLVFGLNGFFNFLPAPPLSGAAGAFLGSLAQTGYMFPLIKGVEVIAGLMLLANFLAPLALVLLAPIIVNITAFHLILAGDPGPAPLLVALAVGLAWAWRQSYAPLFRLRGRAEPSLDQAHRAVQ